MSITERHYKPTELNCDECGNHVGWIYECDNQSEFICDQCAHEIRENLKPKVDSDESWQASEALLRK